MSRPRASGLAELLAEAGRAFRRRDDALFRSLLAAAAAAHPERLDIRLAAANHHIQTGRPDSALEIFRSLGREAPDDAEILFHLAHWAGFAGDGEAAGEAEARLAARRPEKAADLRRIRRIIDAWLAQAPETDLPVPVQPAAPAAIVIFGYRLEPDGGMHPFLVSRLEKALAAAALFPGALLAPTGGVPAAGWTEAARMREWLIARGVAAERIREEGFARDLAENVIYARQILARAGTLDVIGVVSAFAARRAGACLEIAGWNSGTPWRRLAAVASDESAAAFVDDGRDRLKLFRDALRVYGLPMLRIYPYLAER